MQHIAIGIPLQDVARRLGHSEVSTTLKIYTHSNLIQDQKIANVMERYIYNNNDAPNVGIQPLTLLSILTKNPKITNENDLFDTLEWLSNDNITYDDLDTYMKNIEQIKKSDIQEIANKVTVNTIYFLKN